MGDSKKENRRSTKKKKESTVSTIEMPEVHFIPKVFLYIQIKNAEMLPERKHPLELHLKHARNKITKMSDYYTTTAIIKIDELDTYRPTFTLTIEQDSVEDLNALSDNPLLVSLIERVPARRRKFLSKLNSQISSEFRAGGGDSILELSAAEELSDPMGEEEGIDEAEYTIVLGEGYIDLLQFFGKKRAITDVDIYIYPIIEEEGLPIQTAHVTWQIYTLMPLLKNISFCNLAYLSFESIYNLRNDMMEGSDKWKVNISFQSKVRNPATGLFDKQLLCTFGMFEKHKIIDQNLNIKWESMKEHVQNTQSLATHSGCRLGLHKIFQNLLGTDGVDFLFDEINMFDDDALICNSMRRFILGNDISDILQDVLAFNQQHFLIEIFDQADPEDIIFEGVWDLSVMLYPRVNACRFAISLKTVKKFPINVMTEEEKKLTGKKKSAVDKKKGSQKLPPSKPIFCIVSLCLIQPITSVKEELTTLNENPAKREHLKKCLPIKKSPGLVPLLALREEVYKSFDETIIELINYIVDHKIKDKMEAKGYFCCQLRNMINKMIKLVACDFNVRYPTTTHIEFTNLMTLMYRELTERINCILNNFLENKVFRVSESENEIKMVNYLNVIKLMYESHNEELGDITYAKVMEKNKLNSVLNFYVYCYNVEYEDFEKAKEYQNLALYEKELANEYFADLMEIYMDYMIKRTQETTFQESIEFVLNALHKFSHRFPRDMDIWILIFCIYKRNSYMPGMSFARWKFENLYSFPRKAVPRKPISRWELYHNHYITFKTTRAIHFYSTVRMFVRLGMFKFGEIIFEEIASECLEVEKYCTLTTLKILLREVPNKYPAKTFNVDKLVNGDQLKAFLAQTNGNLETYRNNIDGAVKQYERILRIASINHDENFNLALYRLGHHMLTIGEYELAIEAYQMAESRSSLELYTNFCIGKAMYWLGRYQEAEYHFSLTTVHRIHMPDFWAFLALVNLKLGQTYKAIECWKYAKVYESNIISDEIYEELEKIDPHDLDLFVDPPQKKITYYKDFKDVPII